MPQHILGQGEVPGVPEESCSEVVPERVGGQIEAFQNPGVSG